jgi:hypothetical protein
MVAQHALGCPSLDHASDKGERLTNPRSTIDDVSDKDRLSARVGQMPVVLAVSKPIKKVAKSDFMAVNVTDDIVHGASKRL